VTCAPGAQLAAGVLWGRNEIFRSPAMSSRGALSGHGATP